MSKTIVKRKVYTETTEEEDDVESEKRKRVSGINDLSQIGDFRAKKEPIQKAGTIDRIYAKNFKCHSSLEFNLHKSINFILGRNGSGKSAVMDAVILCLGGNARSTGRQASAKTFIKTNCDKAEISITLRNDGEDAYKPQEYGNRITIDRKISSDGTSNYRLLSSDSKLISTKKQEVDNIVEQFNIQVNNPVCFLNQEISKHFLNSSNNSDKYKLFMKASQLESMKQIQEEIECERQNCKALIEDKASHLPKLEEELFEWEDKYKKCQSVDKLKKKLSQLMQEYAWATAIECEKKIEQIHRDQRNNMKSKEKHDLKVQESDEVYKQACEEFNKLNLDISEIKAKSKELNDKLMQAEKYRSEKYNLYKQVQNDLKKNNTQIEKKKLEQKQLREKYEEEKLKNQKDFQEEKQQIEQKIQNLKQELSKIQASEKLKQNENALFTGEIDRISKVLNNRNFEMNQIDRNIETIRGEIKTFRNSSKDKIYKFGDFMNELCNEVKRLTNERKFKVMPLGPIGMFVELVDFKWALAIEQCIGASITSFICANYEDEKLMHQLIARFVRNPVHRPKVIVNNFNLPLHNVSQFRPSVSQYPTVYEMLKIKNHIVANALIDQRKIESVLLLPTRDVAFQIMEQKPKNCSEAFLPNGDQLYFYPSYKAYSCSVKYPKIFVQDVQSNIDTKEADIRRLEEQKEVFKAELKELHDKIQQNRSLKQTNENHLDQYRRKGANLKFNLKEAEEIKIPEPVDLAILEEEVNNLTSEINALELNVQNILNNNEEITSEYQKADSEKKKIDAEKQKHQDFVEKLSRNHTQNDEEKAKAKEALNHYKTLLSDINKKISEKENELTFYENDLKKYTDVASELSPRIETKRGAKAIEVEVQKIELQIKLTEKNHGSEEEISRTYIEMKNRYNNIERDINKQKAFLKKLKQILIERDKHTKSSIESKSVRCAIDFSNLVASRDYNGTLKFDHESQKLEISVHPNKSKDTSDSRDLKSLSGGERSFSTVSFLLALWTIVESPILFLDEFDVFMDQVNRRFAMELILNAAKERLSGQYVFLTPQEMGFVTLDSTLKCFKMPDPTRSIDMPDEESNKNRNN